MIRETDNRWTLLLVMILGAFCFSQIHTVVHVHHSHDDGSFPFEISFHPIGFDPGHVPGHHGGEDHHHAFDLDSSKWLRARSQPTGLKLQQPPPYVIGTGAIPTQELPTILSAAPDPLTLVKPSTRFKCDPRSPPVTA